MYWHYDNSRASGVTGAVSRPSRKRTGAFLVEFAFVAPIMFMLMLATFEFGRAFMVMHILTESARFGCRGGYIGNTYYPGGIVDGTSTQQIQQNVAAYLNAGPYGIKGDTVTVTILYDAPNPLHPDINVQVTVPVSDISWVPNPLFTKGLLSGQFTMRQE
jgi:Flp pilus assembly protein TadG